MVAKTLSIGILSISTAITHGPTLLVAAQAFGALGDAFLAWDGDVAFLRGLGSFLIAHLFYIVLLYQYGGGQEVFQSVWRLIGAFTAVTLASGMLVLLLPRVPRDLKLPIIVYSTAIFTMTITALAVEDSRVVIGAVLFTISDAILAAGRFLIPATSVYQIGVDYSVWSLYYTGQFLMYLGLLYG